MSLLYLRMFRECWILERELVLYVHLLFLRVGVVEACDFIFHCYSNVDLVIL
jgi:hypothetical protein